MQYTFLTSNILSINANNLNGIFEATSPLLQLTSTLLRVRLWRTRVWPRCGTAWRWTSLPDRGVNGAVCRWWPSAAAYPCTSRQDLAASCPSQRSPRWDILTRVVFRSSLYDFLLIWKSGILIRQWCHVWRTDSESMSRQNLVRALWST